MDLILPLSNILTLVAIAATLFRQKKGAVSFVVTIMTSVIECSQPVEKVTARGDYKVPLQP